MSRTGEVMSYNRSYKIYSARANFVLKRNRRRDQINVLVVQVAAEVVCFDIWLKARKYIALTQLVC